MNAKETSSEKVIMFFDGGCPLCSREVAHYKRMDKSNNVRWEDINLQPSVLAEFGLSYSAAMKHLHVRDTSGNIVKGAYAFYTLWKALPGYRILARLIGFPVFLKLMDKFYELFAQRRYEKRMACVKSQTH